jgi:uncharacterized membrane protein
MRRIAACSAAFLLAFLPATPAFARSYFISRAVVEMQVEPDGAVAVTETLTYDFDGSFSGAYRDIPLGGGQRLDDVSVSEAGTAYRSGGCTELGCSSPPGSFGVVDLGNRVRVVWHYSASSEQRTYVLSYRFTGIAKAYDDTVDLNVKVWGDEWQVPAGTLLARVTFPRPVDESRIRVWGHPDTVDGSTAIDGPESVSLEARNVPPGQFVELRVLFPREALTSAGSAVVVEGGGFDQIVEEEGSAADYARRRWIGRIVSSILLLFVPGGAIAAWVFFRHGREPKIEYDREYEQEPPSEDSPAVVQGLVTQGRIDADAFTATMFDFIRRGILKAEPETVDRVLFGDTTDLVLSLVPGAPNRPRCMNCPCCGYWNGSWVPGRSRSGSSAG